MCVRCYNFDSSIASFIYCNLVVKTQVEGEGRLQREQELNGFFRGIREEKLIENSSYSRKANKVIQFMKR